MKTLIMALLGALLVAGATGCCCSHGCNPCGSYGGGCYGGYAQTPNCCPQPCGGCPTGNCGAYPSGAYYGPTDGMTASAAPVSYSAPLAMGPSPMDAQAPGMMQTAMAPLESLPTY